VEHDEMIENADYVFDFGPGAGDLGGEVVTKGTPLQIKKSNKSLTGKFLSGKRKINIHKNILLNFKEKNNIKIFGCSQYNLKNIDVAFPLGKFVCITGVSGSGKSTLLVETLYPALFSYLNPNYRGFVGSFRRLEGKENIDKVILIDQSPIGRTPRSNPVTYTKL
jgi:excinuclease ABC subunit A